jgi:hypothetical protein
MRPPPAGKAFNPDHARHILQTLLLAGAIELASPRLKE